MKYKLSSSCFPIKGYGRSLLYDFRNNSYYYIPNSLCDLLMQNDCSQDWVKNKSEEEKKIVFEYIDFLKERLCLINIEKLDASCFVPISLEKNTSDIISILNMEIHKQPSHLLINNFEKFIYDFKINNLSIVWGFEKSELFNILNILSNTFVNNLELYLHCKKYSDEEVKEIIKAYPVISKIILLGANENSIDYLYGGNHLSINKIASEHINSSKNQIKFVFNKRFFIESHKYNTFYNKRLFINELGDVSFVNNFSPIFNISDYNINKILKSSLLKFWQISKDNIEICKDCEFRHMCYDSRVPKTNGHYWYYETFCIYNPFVCKWEGEEGYVKVEECGTYLNQKGFIPDKRKIEELNKQIWGE